MLLEYSVEYRISSTGTDVTLKVSKGYRRATKLATGVEPTCWLAAGSSIKVTAACKSAVNHGPYKPCTGHTVRTGHAPSEKGAVGVDILTVNNF